MSWQSYVDDHLVGSQNVTKAAIVGIANADVWASSPEFTLSTEEAQALITGFSNTQGLIANGIFISGEKYMFIRCEPGKEIIGKKGTGGLCAFKGNTFVMVSVHNETIVSGACTATTGKLTDYLIEQGM